uniref:S phase cyclin A-associated protein in the endoplasmic reticulum N-terminal domain-containing protein n=1 Tax=Chenopodium quinoa TaxID=63459 RepID=A0A803M0X6_CHEQI
MDDSVAASADDQGSGWFEVKKKHRSSSKFSIQNWVGGFSRQQVNGKGWSSSSKHRSNVSRPGKDSVQRGVSSQSSSSKEHEKDECCLDKCVVGDDNGRPKTPPLKIIMTTSSQNSSTANENVSEKKPDMVHKIKWGDLEDDAISSECGTAAVSELRFGEIGDDDLAMCGTSRNICDLIACNLSKDCPLVDNNTIEVSEATSDVCHSIPSLPNDGPLEEDCKEVTSDVCQSMPSLPNDGPLEENCKEVNEVASIDLGLLSATENIVHAKYSGLDPVEPASDGVGEDSVHACGPSKDVFQCSSTEKPTEIVDSSAPILTLGSLPEAPGNCNAVAIPAGCSSELPNNLATDSSLNTPTSTVRQPEGSESKERFRERLWCFLFENLNRAIDELYLLCELECDLGQVKEAILVLQEAESDFRDLNIRVEEFETMKNSCLSSSDAVMSIKGDHRRPHALSWEVRRMTTSPHRAEILSSSLEAFKKIQEERAKERVSGEVSKGHSGLPTMDEHKRENAPNTSELDTKSRRKSGISDAARVNVSRERRSTETSRSSKTSVQNSRVASVSSASDPITTKLPVRGRSASFLGGKGKKEQLVPLAEVEKLSESEVLKRYNVTGDKEKEKDKSNSQPWKPVDAWKEKRNWEEILAPSRRLSSRVSHSPCMSRRSAERTRVLHDKLMSPEKKKKTAVDLKKEAEEKHARAMRIRGELENERVQKLQRTSEKLNRVSEWHAVRSMKLREGMYARHQRSESRHEAHIAQVVKRAGDESIKVNEVRFITSLNEENKKFLLRQKLQDSEMRRAEKFQVMKTKQKEDMAREEAVIERRKLIEAEKLQRLAETQRRKEEAQLRREEERKASSAAREARTMEQIRRKEERAKAQQEEAELLAQRLAERLSESDQRRKVYLEQIRERASMDFRDQSSPLMRRSVIKEGQGRSTPPCNSDNSQTNNPSADGVSNLVNNGMRMQQSLKRRIKKIRQKLMALKHDLPETSAAENIGIGYRTSVATARAKIGRWVQDLQKLRQERKEGAASIGLITAEMIKYLEGKELELQASRQAGLLDFISSALPASHISKPEACQVTIYLLRLLKVVLFMPTNCSYFLSQNLLPPLIPMLSAALESYIKITASLNSPGSTSSQQSKTSSVNFDSISEVLDGFLWTATMIIGHPTFEERQCQMQDGLLELIVSYQIIHRLRDLFALYDRPPVEGSPFPASILLSIKLLVVLTSRPCAVFPIDWECYPVVLMPENEVEVSNIVKNINSGCLVAPDFQNGLRLSSSVANCDLSKLSCVHKNGQCGESQKEKLSNDSLFSGMIGEKEVGTNLIELTSSNTGSDFEHLDSQKDPEMHVSKSNFSQKDVKNAACTNLGKKDREQVNVKQPHTFLLSAISETGLVCLPSLLTAVLLQANNRLSSEQGSYVLPTNFEEVATCVLKVLNNLALTDITFMQQMLAMPDLKMEFFHIMGFLLTHCTNNWKVASDQVGMLLLESLMLLGYFSLFHPGNQAVLRWGNTPTILHKVCDLPIAFFSDPELMPILAGTLVAVCFGCEQNKGVVQQELSTEMILSLVKFWKSSLPLVRSKSPTGNPSVEDSTESSSVTLERKKLQSDASVKSTRFTTRGSRLSLPKGNVSGSSNGRNGKIRNPRDSRTSKNLEDTTSKIKSPASVAPTVLPLYCRFPPSFVDRAEQFFSEEHNNEAPA